MEGAVFWHWWALGGLLVIVEAFAPGYMLLCFGVAAGLVGLVLVAWPGLDFSFQLLVYAGLLMVCALGWRCYQRVRPAATVLRQIATSPVASGCPLRLIRGQARRGRL